MSSNADSSRNRKVTIEDARKDIRLFFQNPDHWVYQYGDPTPDCDSDAPYYRKQSEVLFEDKYFHWLTHRAVDDLINEGFLSLVKENVAHFVYRSDIRYYKRKINRRKKLIKKYTSPPIKKGVGDHAEMLTKFMFRIHDFDIVERHSNEYKGKKWEKTEHNLDFIIEKDSISYGVEVKNTLSYTEKDEFEVKLEMCEHLGLVPLCILRNAPGPQFQEMKEANGFILEFKTQMYPPGQGHLVREIWKKMRLPVSIQKRIPKKVEKTFLWQHERRVQQ